MYTCICNSTLYYIVFWTSCNNTHRPSIQGFLWKVRSGWANSTRYPTQHPAGQDFRRKGGGEGSAFIELYKAYSWSDGMRYYRSDCPGFVCFVVINSCVVNFPKITRILAYWPLRPVMSLLWSQPYSPMKTRRRCGVGGHELYWLSRFVDSLILTSLEAEGEEEEESKGLQEERSRGQKRPSQWRQKEAQQKTHYQGMVVYCAGWRAYGICSERVWASPRSKKDWISRKSDNYRYFMVFFGL